MRPIISNGIDLNVQSTTNKFLYTYRKKSSYIGVFPIGILKYYW